VVLPPRVRPRIDEKIWAEAMELRRQYSDPLADNRALVRFLCGLTSPRLTKTKLSSHPRFGVFADVPFADLLKRAEGKDKGDEG
jgi:ATP-dependent DNA helicase RecQ